MSAQSKPLQIDRGTQPQVRALLAEFETPEAILAAAERVRDEGFTRWDAHTPFPVHGLDEAMGLKTTRLSWFVMACGLTGAGGGLLMQWWMNAVDYRYVISGKPFFSVPANIPVMFEMTILLSALGAFLGMLLFNGLPALYHVVFTNRRFARATADRFFITIESADPAFDLTRTDAFLRSLGATAVERLED